MISIIGSLIGLGASWLHLWLKGKQQSNINQQEITMLKYKHQDDTQQENIKYDLAVQNSAGKRGFLIQDILSIVFIVLFCVAHINFAWPLHVTWTDQDQAIFSTIVSFWFGYRLQQQHT